MTEGINKKTRRDRLIGFDDREGRVSRREVAVPHTSLIVSGCSGVRSKRSQEGVNNQPKEIRQQTKFHPGRREGLGVPLSREAAAAVVVGAVEQVRLE